MDKIEFNKGQPAICIPFTGKYKDELAVELSIINDKPYQLVEWRADYLMTAQKELSFWDMSRAILGTLGYLKSELDKPLLFTIRTSREGGMIDITPEDYVFINRMVADSGMADLIDIEAFTAEGTDLISEFVKYAHEAGQKVILSNHDFEKTPAVADMAEKYRAMMELGGDIIKLAVMPHSEDDVAALLEAASLINDEYPDQPLIAISMGELGMSSRICAGQFGSVITFAAGKDASAPGQIDAVTLQGYLEKYYK